MERRNFLKGIFGGYAALSGYFSFKYFEGKNKQEKSLELNTEGKFLERVEIPLVYHCNLNCAYCDHFSSIAPEFLMPVDVFKKDMEQLSKITNKNIKEITLLGGEPLLHNNLAEIFKISRACFPESRIELLTNGILLEKQPDSFWQSCHRENITIYVSNYRTGKKLFDFDKLCEIMDKFKANIRISTPKIKFQTMNLAKESKHNIYDRYENCYAKLWPILDQGKFYACSTINGLRFFNKKFPQYALPEANEDFLDIYKISTIDEIIEFYKKPKSLCAHCNYYISGKKDWKLSKKEPGEWYKI